MPLKQRSCHPVQWKSMKTTFIWHGIYPKPWIICSIAIGCTSYQHSPVGSTRCSTNHGINNFQASKLLEEILDQLIGSFSLLCCGFYDEPSIHFSNIYVCKFGSGRPWTYLFQLPSKYPKCKSQRWFATLVRYLWVILTIWPFDSPGWNYFSPYFEGSPRWCNGNVATLGNFSVMLKTSISSREYRWQDKWRRFYPLQPFLLGTWISWSSSSTLQES